MTNSASIGGTYILAAVNTASLSSYMASSSTSAIGAVVLSIKANTAAPGGMYTTAKTVLTLEINGSEILFGGSPYEILSASFLGSVKAGVTFANVRWYWELATASLVCYWDSITIYSDATGTISTLGSGSIASPFVAPIGLPLVGIPPAITCSSAVDPAPVPGVPSTTPPASTSTANISCTAVGGFQFEEPGSGAYSNFPVLLTSTTPPTCPSAAPDPGCPIPTATDTYSLSASSTYNLSGSTGTTPATVQYISTTNGVMGVPNLVKSVKRMNANGSAILLYRAGLPQSTLEGTSTNTDLVGSDDCSMASVSHPHPLQSDFLGVVGNATHAMEDTFGYNSYAVYNASGTSFYGHNDGIPAHDVAQILTRNSAFIGIGTSDFPAPNEFLPYHFKTGTTLDPAAQYLDSWVNPLGLFRHFFPPDSESDANAWPIDGTFPPYPSTYWAPGRFQKLHNSALPSGENRGSRTDLCTACLLDACATQYGDYGQWGVSRFKAQNVTIPAAFTMTSAQSSLFTWTGATAAYGPSITVTPGAGILSVVCNIQLQQFTVAPYFLLGLIQKFTNGWAGANITNVVVQAVGQDGALATISTGVLTTGTKSWPFALTATKYLGSWGQDFGMGVITTDSGSDYTGSGESVPAMADPTQVCVPQILPSRTAKGLRLTFTLNNSNPFTMNYPQFHMPTEPPTALSETGMSGSLLYPIGPGIRFGQWDWYAGSGVASPPSIRLLGKLTAFGGLTTKGTVIDWLATKYAIFEGIDPVSNTTTEISSIYDAHEGNTVDLAAQDTTSHFLVVNSKPTGILINPFAELPPFAVIAGFSRDVNLQPTTTYAQEAWDYSCEPRYLIYPGNTVTDLFQPGTPEIQWTALASVSVPGWTIRQHTHSTTDSEDATFHVERTGSKYGVCSPWHGYFWCGDIGTSGTGISYDVSNAYYHARVWINTSTGHLQIGKSQNSQPATWIDIDTGITSTYAKIRFRDAGDASPIGLLYAAAGNAVKFAETNDGGNTFSVATTLGFTGQYFDFDQGDNGFRWFYGLQDDGTGGSHVYNVYLQLLDQQLNVIRTSTITSVVGIDNAPIAVRMSYDSAGAWRMGILFSQASQLITQFAKDGVNFS